MDGRHLPNSRESNGSAWRTRPHQYELLHPWGLRSGYFRRPATCVGDSHAHGAAVSHLAITEGSLRSRLVAYSRTGAWDGTGVRAPFRVKLRHSRTAVVCFAFSRFCATICRRIGGNSMQKRVFTVLLCLVAVSLSGFAAQKKSVKKPQATGPAPDKAYMQKIWDGWGTLDPANLAQFYAQGPHVFFDIAPLKYDSWDEYQSGVKKELADYKSGKFTVNDDAQVHSAGNSYWATSTIKEDATLKNGKRELATWRWTVVFENQGGKWVIVHEHVSAPAQ
ncbi:MAG: hypothetical protein DMG87_05020 [Acidobacteria bacterium]|nr:MAG: hypothetical protein DMG87_05020 [Acidobacteriota bacterium]